MPILDWRAVIEAIKGNWTRRRKVKDLKQAPLCFLQVLHLKNLWIP